MEEYICSEQREIIGINSNPSPHGLSKYKAYVNTCPRKAWYLDTQRGTGAPLDFYSGRNVGIVGHKLLEPYFLDGTHYGKAIEFSEAVHETNIDIAVRCVEHFVQNAKSLGGPSVFGEVVCVEEELKDTPEKRKMLGIDAPITGRLDLVTSMDEKKVNVLNAYRYNDIIQTRSDLPKTPFVLIDPTNSLRPGHWLIDHKFMGSLNKHMVNDALYAEQYTLYQMQIETGELGFETQGTIQNTVLKYKDRTRFLLIVIPKPSKEARASVLKVIQQGAALRSDPNVKDYTVPSDDNCLGGFLGEPCFLLTDGVCKSR